MTTNSRLSFLLSLILLLSGLTSCQRQPDLNQRLRAYMDPLAANRDFSGIVRIVRGNDLLFEGSWGYADFEREVRHSVDGRFPIASISKTMTAAAVARLKSAGTLSYDDFVSDYLPNFAHGDQIRIRHLLRFESGLAEVEFDPGRRLTSDELLEEIGSSPLLFEPGTEIRYGNSGFNVLAILVERVTGQPFEEHLRDAFFDPLGMRGTGLRTQLENEDQTLVTPHKPGPPPNLVFEVPYANPYASFGSGGLYSTAEDLTKWGLALAGGEIAGIGKEEYPWGWGTTEIEEHPGLTQSGMQSGFTASLQIFPGEDIVIVLLNNIEAGMWGDWAKDLARIVFSAEPLMEHERYDYLESLPDEARERYPGWYELNPDRFVEIREMESHLWLHPNGNPAGHYLLPLTGGEFQLRDFAGRIYFNRLENGEVESLTWRLPDVWDALDETYMRRD